MTIAKPFNLLKWVEDHRDEFKPPVMNKQFYPESEDAIIFCSVGPNNRNDYHVNPTEEIFYQLKGDIAVKIRPLDGSKPHHVVIREGEMWLCPRWVPHRPQRPEGTIGLIVEFPRVIDGKTHEDGLHWYCDECETLVHKASFRLAHIDEDLHKVMDAFWNGPVEGRTCPGCGNVIQRAGHFDLSMAQPAGV
ncbi:MAG: 3-hydroxyanthranilate 3,4-dioxygenase [Phycisphaerales bacterium JB037]